MIYICIYLQLVYGVMEKSTMLRIFVYYTYVNKLNSPEKNIEHRDIIAYILSTILRLYTYALHDF